MEAKIPLVTIILTSVFLSVPTISQAGEGGGGEPEEVIKTPFDEAKGLKELKFDLHVTDSDIKFLKADMRKLEKELKQLEAEDRAYDKEKARQKAALDSEKRTLRDLQKENKTGKNSKGQSISSGQKTRNEKIIKRAKDGIVYLKEDLKSLAKAQKEQKQLIRNTKKKLKALRQKHKNLLAKRGRIQDKIDRF